MDEKRLSRSRSDVYGRRHFMQLAASTAVGGTLLAACGGNVANQQLKTVPAATTLPQSEISATMTASVGKTYFPGGAPHVPDAYTAPFPAFQSVKYVPGNGGKVRVFEIMYGSPSISENQNKFWQELNKRLNIDWQPNQVFTDDYDTKATVMLNSNPPPDLVLISDGDSVFRVALQQGAFNDLTSFLSGDALKEFPNLSLIPPSIWNNSKYQGKIYGVPRARVELGDVLMYRKDITDKIGLGIPQNPDEFYNWLVSITKSNVGGKKVYGFGGRAFFGNNAYVRAMFGCPNGWRVESDGSFTNVIETDEFKQALDFERRLWAAGVYHPDSPAANNKQGKTGFEAGKYASYQDGFSAITAEQQRSMAITPNSEVRVLVPTNNQGKVTRFLSTGYAAMTGIPAQATGDADRIKELLRIVDYISAPTFSIESNFLSYGIDGWDSKVGSNGLRQLTDKGRNEMGELTTLANGPQIFYFPQKPSYVVSIQDDVRKMVQDAIPDPSWGLYSPTADKQNTSLSTMLTSNFQRIVRGQDPLSALSDVIKQWQSQGGAKIKQELAGSYRKVQGK
ncbi:MAG TPA: extracellular solute-binding protein [Ktedonobacteraceae bacterium]|nr:extracellular solute-binding protein [Ktedonobacteraceae bacterium]